MKAWIALVLVVLLTLNLLVSSRTMWGVRKKQKEEDMLDEKMADAMLKAELKRGSDGMKSKRVEKKAASRTKASSNPFGSASASPAEMLQFYLSMIDQFEEMVSSNQFDQYFDRDMVEELLKNVGEKVANPEVQAALEQVNLDDLDSLKVAISQGLALLRQFIQQAMELVNDPKKLLGLINELPSETRGMVQALLSGDVSSIRQMIENFDGIDSQQKGLILDLMDGNYGNLLSKTRETLSQTNDAMELARQNLLSNPELAVASGISLETLQDPELFQAFMKQTMDALLENGGEDLFSGLLTTDTEEEVRSSKSQQNQQQQRQRRRRHEL